MDEINYVIHVKVRGCREDWCQKNIFKVDYITLHVIWKSVVCHRNMYCIA